MHVETPERVLLLSSSSSRKVGSSEGGEREVRGTSDLSLLSSDPQLA